MGLSGVEDWERRLRGELAEAGRFLWNRGLIVGREGNISARIPGTHLILIKPSGTCMGELKPEDFILINIDGGVVRGEGRPSIETPMHTRIYRARADVGAVVHTHSTYATALGIAGVEVRAVWLKAALLQAERIPIVEYHRPGSHELAEAVVERLGGGRAVLLRNHGVLAVGRNVQEACAVASAVEETAKIQFIAMLVGRPRTLTRREIEELVRLRE